MAKRVVPIKKANVQTLVNDPNTKVVNIPVEVVDEKPGPKTANDKIKEYYHTFAVIVGFLLSALTESLPVIPESIKQWVVGAIGVLTILSIALKGNPMIVE